MEYHNVLSTTVQSLYDTTGVGRKHIIDFHYYAGSIKT